MLRELQRFVKDESGPELVEWAIVTLILILATFAILQLIGDELKTSYNRILDTLKAVNNYNP
jgi:Flp pilus assembly pilin Flp